MNFLRCEVITAHWKCHHLSAAGCQGWGIWRSRDERNARFQKVQWMVADNSWCLDGTCSRHYGSWNRVCCQAVRRSSSRQGTRFRATEFNRELSSERDHHGSQGPNGTHPPSKWYLVNSAI